MLLDQLQTRYELKSRKGIYARIKALSLQLPKDNKRRSYATEQMVQQLDDLDAHLKRARTSEAATRGHLA